MSDRDGVWRTNDDERDGGTMGPDLSALVQTLREDVGVSDGWRRELVARVERARIERRRRRRWLIGAGLAAAAVVCITVGAAARRATPASDASAPVHFQLRAPAATRVSLVGDFDAWNPAALPMRRRTRDGAWDIDVRIPNGRHSFAYMVDGRLTVDSTAALSVEDNFGVPSSVIVVQRSN